MQVRYRLTYGNVKRLPVNGPRPVASAALPGLYLIPRRRRVAKRLSPIQLVGEVVADEAIVFALLGDLRRIIRVLVRPRFAIHSSTKSP